MNKKAIGIYIGHLLVLEAATMLPAVAIAGYNKEWSSAAAFGIAIAALLIFGLLLSRMKKEKRGVYAREGFVTVALGWIVISLFGMLPFVISGGIPKVIDALFETVSGFTTTGATILSDVEALPRSLLYWRSFTHWLGGMGVLVCMLAIASLSKGSGETIHLLRAESPGPSVEKLTPTIKDTARVLYVIYIVLTVVLIILLVLGGMPLFDSVNHAFSTAGTGGFGVRNGSIGAYNSIYIDIVLSVFMVLFGVNFSLYYLVLLKQWKTAIKSEELRLYLGIVLTCTLIIAFYIRGAPGGFGEALRESFFQVTSIISTTGFYTADFDKWPQMARYLIILLMWIGACAGSTAGGMKVSRILILWKSIKNQMQVMLHPKAVRPVRMDGKTLDEETVRGVYAFLGAYMFIAIISVFLVSMDSASLGTNVTAVVTCIANCGPGLEAVGPLGNFGFYTSFSKVIFILDMLIGRLEIFPMLLLFSSHAWKRQA